MPLATLSDILAAAGALCLGIGSLMSGLYALRSQRRKSAEDCEERLRDRNEI